MPWVAQPFDSYWTENENRCRIWHGGKSDRGYGYYYDKPKMVRAHRYAWEQVNDHIPAGMTIDHLCKVKLCVNPEHLEVVTHSENILRHQAPGGRCRKGHDNWHHRADGRGRECKTCKAERAMRRATDGIGR